MSITPTTLNRVNKAKNKVAVYDADRQKAVLVFSSISLCTKYLFGHLIFCQTDLNRYSQMVRAYSANKKTEDKNIFTKRLAYRFPTDSLIAELNDRDFIVLDSDFVNENFKIDKKTIGTYNEYALESILEVGDLVELKYGIFKGYATEVLEVKDKSRHTPGTKYFALKINGVIHDYKANVLSLVIPKSTLKC
jgi:hypothetical protein